MSQSRTLFVGLEGHQECLAVTDVAHEHHAEVVSLATVGTRQDDIAQLRRRLLSKSQHRVFVYTPVPAALGSTAI